VLSAMDGWAGGTTLAGLAATALLPVSGNWRWMLALMILPALLLFWVRRGIPSRRCTWSAWATKRGPGT